ncbi:MAG: DNA mismatch repair endonuclease MutL [Pseudomonadota bacterium]
MNVSDLNIRPSPPRIRQLDPAAQNRIAAGEVIERPASAVKELVENAIDAGARRIAIDVADGGKTLIRVSDDGHGIAAQDLALALARHATSKIDGSDLLNIHTFGFRGEALPSMGAVARMTITSRVTGAEGAEIVVSGGTLSPPRPAALSRGTQVELRDLFHATPARLKFLRSDRAETAAINDVVKRLAMAEPTVGFTQRDLTGGSPRTVFTAEPGQGDFFDVLCGRLRRILGADFIENALPIDTDREGISVTGFASLPTFSRGSSAAQYLFVNGRPVRDPLLIGAIRGAYADFLHRDRHPVMALFLECDPNRVDVNVHPAKTQVRFREPGVARGLVVTALRAALGTAGHRASTTVAGAALDALRPEPSPPEHHAPDQARVYQAPLRRPGFTQLAESPAAWSGRVEHSETKSSEPEPTGALGAARAQVHQNYIVAQTADGIVIVDQHAAHERLVYERLKAALADRGCPGQGLLIPEVVSLDPDAKAAVLGLAPGLARLGLGVEDFGPSAVCVRETPAILGPIDAASLVRDIADELQEIDQSLVLETRLEAVLSRIACHGSVRSGRSMGADEMNALLREMEATPYSGQCNHGRPTYVELKLSDIERLFGRR